MHRDVSSAKRLAVVLMVALAGAGCAGGTSSSNGGEGSVDRSPPSQGDAPASGDEPAAGDGPAEQEAAPEPAVTFSAADAVVPSGAGTTLTWSSSDATSCEASGGWSGTLGTQGSIEVGPLGAETTFSLSCSGDGGSSLAMLSVSVIGSVSLSWAAPEENEDGSPLWDLSGYRIYYGSFSQDYTEEVLVDDPATTALDLQLPSGAYYIAMTAYDAEGNESDYSNEVVRSVD